MLSFCTSLIVIGFKTSKVVATRMMVFEDKALVPFNYDASSGIILDNDLFEILIKPLKSNACLCMPHFSVMDSCHSGTMLDLPYV